MPRRRWAPGERFYRALIILLIPLRAWARLEVHGVEELRAPGGVLLVANHDSSVEPLALAEATMRVRRPLRFLTRANLWRLWPLGIVLDGTRQIPIERGAGDLDALEHAVSALRAGEAVCIFPEGTISRGERLRARRGVARLAEAAPDARIVLAAVSGGTDLVRFPAARVWSSSCSLRRPARRCRERTMPTSPAGCSARSASACHPPQQGDGRRPAATLDQR